LKTLPLTSCGGAENGPLLIVTFEAVVPTCDAGKQLFALSAASVQYASPRGERIADQTGWQLRGDAVYVFVARDADVDVEVRMGAGLGVIRLCHQP